MGPDSKKENETQTHIYLKTRKAEKGFAYNLFHCTKNNIVNTAFRNDICL